MTTPARFTGHELDALRRSPTGAHVPQMHCRTWQGLLRKWALERVRPGIFKLTPVGLMVRRAARVSYQQGRLAGLVEARREAIDERREAQSDLDRELAG